MKPEQFQLAGAAHLSSQYHAALGDERGLGKTLQAILAADKVGAKRVLVTCPASVRTSWREHVDDFYGAESVTAKGWDIISYNRAADLVKDPIWFLRSGEYDVWIGDELHFCKTLESQRTQAILGPNGVARRARYKWPLSGTFTPNHRPLELYPMLKALAPAFRDITFKEYTQRYCGAFFDGRAWNLKGAAHLDELNRMMEGFLLRRTKAWVYPDRKAPLVTLSPVDLSAADLREVHAIEDEILGREDRISAAQEHFSQLGDTSRLLRVLGNAMVPSVLGFVSDLLEVEPKVVIFAHHTDVIDRLRAETTHKGWRPVVYQGGMSDSQKRDAVAIFQAPECRVFIGQRQAAGTGINGLQTVCSTMVLAEPSWVPGETDQLIGRLDRIGQADELVNAYIMYARNTLSATVVGVHARKEAVGRKLGAGAGDFVDLL